MSEWARAHFFVGAKNGGMAGPVCEHGLEANGVGARRTGLLAGRLNWMQLEKVREAAERVAGSLGLEIFDVEWKIGKQRLLRVYIDRLPGPQNPEGLGVTHKDCERVSEQLSVILDVEDLIPGPSSYVLEVSSPGLDRKLIKPADYQRFVGRLAKVWVTDPIENQNYFEGRLAGYADGIVKLNVRDRELAVPFSGIKKANLVVEL
jgi:ribosome maturation factor RimP